MSGSTSSGPAHIKRHNKMFNFIFRLRLIPIEISKGCNIQIKTIGYGGPMAAEASKIGMLPILLPHLSLPLPPLPLPSFPLPKHKFLSNDNKRNISI